MTMRVVLTGLLENAPAEFARQYKLKGKSVEEIMAGD
jgi:hypothetical protein